MPSFYFVSNIYKMDHYFAVPSSSGLSSEGEVSSFLLNISRMCFICFNSPVNNSLAGGRLSVSGNRISLEELESKHSCSEESFVTKSSDFLNEDSITAVLSIKGASNKSNLQPREGQQGHCNPLQGLCRAGTRLRRRDRNNKRSTVAFDLVQFL